MPCIRMTGLEGVAELRHCAWAQGSHISAVISSAKHVSWAPQKQHVVKLVFEALTLSWCLWLVL